MERKEQFEELFKGVRMDTVLAKFRYLGKLQGKKANAFRLRFDIADDKYPFDGEEFEYPESSVEAAEELVEAIGEDEFRAEEEAREQFRLILKKTEKKQEQIFKHSFYMDDEFQDGVIRAIKGFPGVAEIENDAEMMELLITAMDMSVENAFAHSMEVLKTLVEGLSGQRDFFEDDEDEGGEEDLKDDIAGVFNNAPPDETLKSVDDILEEYETPFNMLFAVLKAWLELEKRMAEEKQTETPKGPVRIATPHGYVNKPNNESTGK